MDGASTADPASAVDGPAGGPADSPAGRREPGPADRTTALAGAFGSSALLLTLYAPVLYYMTLHWYASDDYSHGFLIVPLALYFVWQERDRLRGVAMDPSWWGLVPLLLGTATLTVGRLGTELTSMRSSFVLTLIGIVLLTVGTRAFRVLWFPLCFLFLMVPLPQSLVNVVAFPLQLLAADFAVNALFYLEIPVLREGNIIHLPESTLFVAQACSGLRSLMALITLGVVVGYMFRKSLIEWALVVLSAIPIAIFVNSLRVALTGYLSYSIGEEAAQGWIHQTEGLFTFGAAFVLLLVQSWLLSRFWPERLRFGHHRSAEATS